MMKTLLLTILFALSSFALMAQDIGVNKDSLSLESQDLNEFEYVLKGYIQNFWSADQDYQWRKQKMDCPDNWSVSMCIGELCYPPDVDSNSESMTPNFYGEYSLHLMDTGGEEGCCTVLLELWSLDSGTNDTLVVFSAFGLGENACTTTNNTESNQRVNFSYYPNPAQSYLNVHSDIPTEIVISNSLGQSMIVEEIAAGKSVIGLAHLNQGMYTISFKQNGDTIVTKSFIKR